MNEDTRLAVQQLVNEEVIFQNGQKSGLEISDAEIRDEIVSIDIFKENGVFKTSLYLSYLQNQRSTADGFENQIRKFILNSKVDRSFRHAMYISELENQKNKEIDQVQIQIRYVRIPLSSPFSTDNLQEEEIKKWQELVEHPTELEKELRAQKLEWIDSSVVSLRTWENALPFSIDTEKLFNEVVKVIPHSKVIPHLFSIQEGIVLVALKKFEMKPALKTTDLDSPFSTNAFLTFGLSRMIFSEWLEGMKSQSKVQINPKIFN